MGLFKSKPAPDNLPPRRRMRPDEREQSPLDGGQTFRRGRTLTGSRSGLFGSATEDQADIKSPRAMTHELAAKRVKLSKMFALAAAGVLFFACLLWQLIAGFSIHGADGVAVASTTAYQDTINEYFRRHPLERFRFSLNQDNLTGFVAKSHPEVSHIELKTPDGLASSQLELTMRRPVAQWSVAGQAEYVDADGIAFSVNYYGRPSIQIIDESGIDPTSGAAVASGRFLGFAGRVMTVSSQLGYKAQSITIPPATTRQIAVMFDDVPYSVKFTIDRPVGEQVEDMDRSIKYLSSRGEAPEYLDVRVSGRAYYK